MKIWHRFSVAWDQDRQKILEELGVKMKFSPLPGGGGLCTFRIAECDQNWEQVKGFAERWGLVGIVETEFSKAEILAAPYCALVPNFVQGYPQPEEDYGYRLQTYDATEFCEKCGIGLRQVAPFRLKAEPKWGRSDFLQLNWVFDEFFIRTDSYRTALEPLGVATRDVLTVRGNLLESVLQVRADSTVDLELSRQSSSNCSQCHRTRFDILKGVYLPALTTRPMNDPIARTRQWFGSGAKAFNLIIVSQEVVAAILDHGLRGVGLHPCAGTS